MGGRTLSKDQQNADKAITRLIVVVNVGAAGAVTMQQWNPNPNGANPRTYSTCPISTAYNIGGFRGVWKVVRTGTGLWTVSLQNSYQRLLGLSAFSQFAGGLAAALTVACNSTNTNVNAQPGVGAGPTVGVAFLSSTATAADPGSGEQIVLNMEFQDTTAS